MKLMKLNPKKSKAQAMVEFAIALPVLLMLLYGILEAGRLLFLYSTVVTASRQAVRYGSATGIGTDGSERRYQDCDGIRNSAQKAGFLGAFDTVTIRWDDGPADSTPTIYCTNPAATFDNSPFPDFPKKDNSSRISVEVIEHFTPLVPKLVPFIARDVKAISARTVIVGITMEVTPVSPPGMDPTITTITADTPDPSTVGGAVIVTVTVTGGSTTPTGSITITGADVNCTINNYPTNTSCTVFFNSGGTKLLNATYNGDSTHLASSDSNGETHYVLYSTVVNITAHLPDPSTAGQSVTITVTATSALPVPDGTVINITGDASCSITLTNGTGNCNVTFAAPTGEKTITATYAGDAQHSGSSSTTIHDLIVDKDTITRITSHTPDPSEINQTVTVSVKVIGLTTTPTGTVTVSATGTTGCTITLSGGTGSCTVTFTSAGAKSISAAYSGSANHNASTSAPKGHTVNLQATTTTITAHTPDPSQVGGTVTVTVSVTGGSTAPTGTVTISGASAPCTITLPATSCTVVFSSTGSKTLSAVYSGDATHATSNTTATHTVNAPSATPVPSCAGITHGLITITGNTMSMTITNPWGFPLTTGAGTVTWNDDKGHQTTSDKTLSLQSIVIGTTTIWSGSTSNVSTQPFTTPAIIPPNSTVTIVLTFDQSYDNLDGTENIYINLTTPGCELNPIQS